MRAGSSGVLQELPLDVGQQVALGHATGEGRRSEAAEGGAARFPRRAPRSWRWVRRASIEIQHDTVRGHVTHVDPAVQDGSVVVDVAFEGGLPMGAKPDLSIEGRIELERLRDVLYTGKPASSVTSKRSAVQAASPTVRSPSAWRSARARRRSAQSRWSSGLREGDRVILSDMSEWDRTGRIELRMRRGPRETVDQKTVDPAIDIGRVFRTEDVETHALCRRGPRDRAGQLRIDRGAVGLRQVHAAVDPRLARCAEPGSLRARRPRGRGAVSRPSARACARQQIGFIFQGFNLIGELSVYENVELPLVYLGVPASERRERVEAALERVQMAHRTKHLPSQLSGGQQQRVAVARAVVGKPLILLADEPTGNLDSKNGEQVMGLLSELHKEGATLCMVTHDPRYASFADRSVRLFDGRIVEERSQPDALAV